VDDLGQLLGCGAYVSKLRRTRVADYPSEKMVTFEQLEALLDKAQREQIPLTEILDPLLIPMDSAVKNLAKVELAPESASDFMHGQPVAHLSTESFADGHVVRVYLTQTGTFLGVAQIDKNNQAAPKRLVVFPDQTA
jgi:tRNA pseudouridine55 synthase